VPITDRLSLPGGDSADDTDPPAAAADALPLLFRRHALPLTRTAVLLTGDDGLAEEIVQDAFLGLHRRWLRHGPPTSPEAYLRTSVVNGCRSALRRRRAAALARVLHLVPAASAESAVLLREEQTVVLTAMNDLSRRQREVLVLRYYADLDDLEIATVLGVSRGTVSSTISRALGVLKVRLGGTR
jgi:RNA polymerase sigma-70 factor (sigma-E family)